jgi:hypothetical protein
MRICLRSVCGPVWVRFVVCAAVGGVFFVSASCATGVETHSGECGNGVIEPRPLGQVDWGSSEPGGMATGRFVFYQYNGGSGYTATVIQ